MNLSTTLPDAVTDTIRHAAEATRHAAASTAHTLSTFAEDAQHQLEDVAVPGRSGRARPGRRMVVLGVVIAAVLAAVIARRWGRSDAPDSRAPDSSAAERAATDAEPVTSPPGSPLASVR